MKNIKCLLLVAVIFLTVDALAQTKNKPAAVFNHLAIYVVDLNKSAEFYTNTIGFDTIPEPFHDGKHVWLRIGPNNALHIIKGSGARKEYYKNNHICFSVSSVDLFTERLKKKSIPFEDINGKKDTFSKRPDGVKQLWLQDPDGYWIEINDAKE